MWAWKLTREVKPNLGRTSMTRFDNYQEIFRDRTYLAQFAAWKHQHSGIATRCSRRSWNGDATGRSSRYATWTIWSTDVYATTISTHTTWGDASRWEGVGGLVVNLVWGFPFMGISLRDLKNLHFLLRWGRDYGRPFPTCQLLNILFFVPVPCPILVAAAVSATVSVFLVMTRSLWYMWQLW